MRPTIAVAIIVAALALLTTSTDDPTPPPTTTTTTTTTPGGLTETLSLSIVCDPTYALSHYWQCEGVLK